MEIPVAPRPAMARPTMRQLELGAAAHKMEPTSKIPTDVIKIHLISYIVYSFPNINWEQHDVNRYAEPYQPMSESELNSDVIVGMATLRIERSCKVDKNALANQSFSLSSLYGIC